MNRLLLCLVAGVLIQGAHASEPKTLRYAFEVAETGFDPAELSDLYSRYLTSEIFDAPLRYAYLAAPGTLEPSTADGMPEVSGDYKTFTIRIKKGIYFTDDPAFNGQRRELTAEDYVYSYKRIFDPHWNSPNEGTLELVKILGMNELRQDAVKSGHFDYDRPVEGLRSLDRYTFQFRLGVPSPRFLENLADASTFGAVAREVVEKYHDTIMEHPVGTGPFILTNWVRSSHLVLERNPNYRLDIFHVTPDPNDADAQRIARELDGRRLPLIDRVEISIIEESQPRWLSFLDGEQDFMENMPLDLAPLAVPNNQLAPTLAKKHVQLERVPNIDVAIILFNMDNPVLGGYEPEKIALRRAINLGFDTAEFIRSYQKFQALPAQSLIMPGLFGYDPELRTENGVTDVVRARAILDSYGYVPHHGGRWRENPDGSPLIIEFRTQPDQRSRIRDEICKKSLDALDIQSSFKPAKWPENLKAAQAGAYMAWALGSSASGPDPSGVLIEAYGPSAGAENYSRFRLPAYDELYREQDSIPNGPERAKLIRQMQEILVAYAPMKVMVHRFDIDLAYPWVKYYRRWPFAHRDFWRYVDIDQAEQAKSARRS
jgi:ABC-type transport system substrate-binding protein